MRSNDIRGHEKSPLVGARLAAYFKLVTLGNGEIPRLRCRQRARECTVGSSYDYVHSNINNTIIG